MNRYSKYLHTSPCLLLLTLTLLSACGKKADSGKKTSAQQETVSIDDSLRQRLAAFCSKPRVKGKMGISVYDLAARHSVYNYQERTGQPSASCMKILTGLAGIHLLGANYKYTTSLYTTGKMVGDTLVGNVYLKGSLDPQITDDDLSMFADHLRKRGIRQIRGRMILDLVLKEPVKSEAHWYPWDLSFSRYGVFYKGEARVRQKMLEALRRDGFRLQKDDVVLGATPAKAHCLYKFHRPLSLIIERMWKNSANTQATALLYTIGHRVNAKGDYVAEGVGYLRRFLRDEIGEKDTCLVVHDGCGLCTHNHLSPLSLVSMLRYGFSHDYMRTMLFSKLSISGVDGTLRVSMAKPELKGKVFAKTGTLSHPFGISSLAGFCRGKNGHMLAFSIMCSEMSVLDAHVLQKELCEELVK